MDKVFIVFQDVSNRGSKTEWLVSRVFADEESAWEYHGGDSSKLVEEFEVEKKV